jgi:hypothetical protein
MTSLLEKMDKYDGERAYLTESELEDRFEEHMDDAYDRVEIGGLTYYAGAVLRAVDPTAFRTYLADWLSLEVEDGNLFEDEDGDVYEKA